MATRLLPAAVLALTVVLSGCAGFGRKVNQALPEFMRADPGAEEKEKIAQLRKRVESSPEEAAARSAAYAMAKEAYDAGRWDEAADRFEDFLEDHPASEFDEEGRFLWGEARYRDDEFVSAFSAYQSYRLNFPVSNRTPIVVERIFEMGREYIEGRRKSFFGLVGNYGRGEEMLSYLVTNFPHAERADDAQWLLGRYYVEDEDWTRAIVAWDFLIKQYPNSEWFPAARYFAGYCRYRLVKGNYYDQNIVREARARFASYLNDFPEGEWRDEAREIVAYLDQVGSEKLLRVGEWYVSQGKPYSARYYFLRVRTLYPETPAAQRAGELFAEVAQAVPELPEEVREYEAERARREAERAAARGELPATRPAAPETAPAERR